MSDTMTSVLGVLAGVLLLAAIALGFFVVEKQASEYAERRCRCQCAETAVPPVAPGPMIFNPSKGVTR